MCFAQKFVNPNACAAWFTAWFINSEVKYQKKQDYKKLNFFSKNSLESKMIS